MAHARCSARPASSRTGLPVRTPSSLMAWAPARRRRVGHAAGLAVLDEDAPAVEHQARDEDEHDGEHHHERGDDAFVPVSAQPTHHSLRFGSIGSHATSS